MAHARELSVNVGVRRAGTEGDRLAAAYIQGELERLGMTVRQERFALPQGGESRNVIASLPGFAGGRHLVLGGHYDTTLTSPGGNDNATGVGVVLDLARALRAQPAALPVVVVLFGAEEVQVRRIHHLGSLDYVGKLDDAARREVVAMLNVDMVGRGDSLVFGRLRDRSAAATKRLLALAAELGIPARERITPDWSDHGSFLKAGIDAGWIWSGEDAAYHSPRDTFDRVRAESVLRAGRLANAFVRSHS